MRKSSSVIFGCAGSDLWLRAWGCGAAAQYAEVHIIHICTSPRHKKTKTHFFVRAGIGFALIDGPGGMDRPSAFYASGCGDLGIAFYFIYNGLIPTAVDAYGQDGL